MLKKQPFTHLISLRNIPWQWQRLNTDDSLQLLLKTDRSSVPLERYWIWAQLHKQLKPTYNEAVAKRNDSTSLLPPHVPATSPALAKVTSHQPRESSSWLSGLVTAEGWDWEYPAGFRRIRGSTSSYRSSVDTLSWLKMVMKVHPRRNMVTTRASSRFLAQRWRKKGSVVKEIRGCRQKRFHEFLLTSGVGRLRSILEMGGRDAAPWSCCGLTDSTAYEPCSGYVSIPKCICHNTTTIKLLTILYIRNSKIIQNEQNQSVNRAGFRDPVLRHHKRRHTYFRKLNTIHTVFFHSFCFLNTQQLACEGYAMQVNQDNISPKHMLSCLVYWLVGHRSKIQIKNHKDSKDVGYMSYFPVQRWHQHLMRSWLPALHHADPQEPQKRATQFILTADPNHNLRSRITDTTTDWWDTRRCQYGKPGARLLQNKKDLA